jgi:hypothetical protein
MSILYGIYLNLNEFTNLTQILYLNSKLGENSSNFKVWTDFELIQTSKEFELNTKWNSKKKL